MKNIFKVIIVILTFAIFFSTVDSVYSQTINSLEALEEYLDKQPANSHENPIKISMNINDDMVIGISGVIHFSGKYVSLDLSRSTGLTSIEDFRCIGLTSVTIPNSVNGIYGTSFDYCPSLTEINVDAGNSSYTSENGVLYNKNKTTLIKYPSGKKGSFAVPNSVTSIYGYAFRSCTGLTSVTFPNSITRIEQDTFAGCTSLASVTIPSSVKSISFNAFSRCDSLTRVTFQGTMPGYMGVVNAVPGQFGFSNFPGDLDAKYYAGGMGTYTRQSGSNTWTKQ